MRFFMHWLARLPLPWLHRLGRLAGVAVYLWPGRYRRRLKSNAARAGYAQPAFARRAAAQTGAMILETPKIWLHTPECLAKVHSPEDDVVHTALAEKRGILYLTPHLGCFEITARYLASHFNQPITVMYRPPRQAALAPLLEHARDMPGMKAVPATMQGVREFVRALRRGEAVGMLPDQVPSGGEGVWAPFFGKQALTMTLAGRLAKQTGVAVILVAGERLPRGEGWKLHFVRLPEPAANEPPGGFERRLNTAMENLIHRFPEQYLWSYNRYKIPDDAPPRPEDDA